MDPRLHERLTSWHAQIAEVTQAEKTYLTLEANSKPLFYKLFLEYNPADFKKKITTAEREACAYTHPDWKSFQEGLVVAQAEYNHQRRLLELKVAAFQASYLESKIQGEATQRFPKGIT